MKSDIAVILRITEQALGLKLKVSDPDRRDVSSYVKVVLPDSARGFKLIGADSRAEYFLQISPMLFPNVVADAVAKAERFKAVLPDSAARMVMTPKFLGEHRDRSFAVYQFLQPFPGLRGVLKPARLVFLNSLSDWLAELAAITRSAMAQTDSIRRHILEPIEFVAEAKIFSDDTRRFARDIWTEAERPEFSPTWIASHGDLWLGNVMLARPWWSLGSSIEERLRIIDWSGSNLQGLPYVDLFRMWSTQRFERRFLPRVAANYSAQSGVPVRDMAIYVVANLGQIGMSLGQFPEDRYRVLVETAVTAISREPCNLAIL